MGGCGSEARAGAVWVLFSKPLTGKRDALTIFYDVCYILVFVGALNHFFSALLVLLFAAEPCSGIDNALPIGDVSETAFMGFSWNPDVEPLILFIQIVAGVAAVASFALKLLYKGALVFLAANSHLIPTCTSTASAGIELPSTTVEQPNCGCK